MSHHIRLLRVARVRNDRLGGMSRTMYETGDHLQKMGFEVDYLFDESFSRLISKRFWKFSNPWEAAALAYGHCMKRGGCDLIELHESLAFGAGVLRRMLPAPVKVIGFSYGIESRAWPVHADYCRSHGISLRPISRLMGALQARQSLAGLRLCDQIVCSSSEDVRYLEGLDFSRDRLTLHHSGVDNALLAAGRGELRMSNRRILYLGNWIHRKGILELVVALQRLLREHPDLRITIAGSRAPGQDLLAHFDEASRRAVEVIPCIDSDAELCKIYANHDIFVLPSHFEGQPLVMMEAAAFGLAIVTTNVCGMRDFIRDGENGLLTPPADAGALYAKLKLVVANLDLRLRLGGAARAGVADFTWERSAQNLANAYRQLVSH